MCARALLHLQEVHKVMESQGILPRANLYRGYRQVLRDGTTQAKLPGT